MKTYVITLSVSFMAKHPRAGEPTFFKEMFLERKKIHTIRCNYSLWKQRIDEVIKGNAVLSIRQWTGKPYKSKQKEIARLTKENHVGIQKLTFDGSLEFPKINIREKCNYNCNYKLLAFNDGLAVSDWKQWFKDIPLDEEFAIIHFTKFRYY